ncbi:MULTISPECIES: AMP-binding protein [unclassified Microbacterium]|uniref:AMP-binding protein n=1 Tax=unclassified Microbacterium TaxID=2609290 RepID=UPI00214ADB15|nr:MULTISPECIES: AMP-binding protein [unclassified Microbacterium]MCR2808877.1 AMP-binding protein [Microbacterium sp. zg.B185]WIM18705.1 AMP-binding protein [Microbacterium sp. zg-B185]
MPQPTTLVESLQATADMHGNERGLRFYDAPESSAVRGWGDLDVRARTIAAALSAEGFGADDTAVIALEPGLLWADAAYGVLYAGLGFAPMPVAGPALAARIAALAQAAAATVLVADQSVVDLLGEEVHTLGIRVLTVEELVEAGDPQSWIAPAVTADSTAILMFTSGSTGDPKGVIATHGSLLATARACAESLSMGSESTAVGWSPLHHAMGLLLQVITPASTGGQSVVTATAQFQKRPMLWLQLMSTHRATVSFAGNFAFALCTQLATDEQIAQLDLSSLEVLLSGSEPVRIDTVNAFLERFAATGLSATTVAPAMGMTEAMLISVKPAGEPFVALEVDAEQFESGTLVPALEGRTVQIVSCGRAIPSTDLAIVDPETLCAAPEGTIGELWISSPSVSPGYFRRPDATAETFGHRLAGDERDYLRSGDLAAVLDGELFVTGRLKEVIILRGRNIYPQDIEAAVAALSPSLGIAAAFELDGARAGVGVVIEVDEETMAEAGETLQGLGILAHEKVTSHFSVPAVSVTLTTVGSLPRTATGKVRRKPTRTLLESGGLPIRHCAGSPVPTR